MSTNAIPQWAKEAANEWFGPGFLASDEQRRALARVIAKHAQADADGADRERMDWLDAQREHAAGHSKPSGVELIAAERARQISKEGWSAGHDDKHAGGELAVAGALYAFPSDHRVMVVKTVYVPSSRGLSEPDHMVPVLVSAPRLWPWEAEWWKPTPKDRINELVKAGALIAAEIDRLNRSTP
jgi:hypothetical protein